MTALQNLSNLHIHLNALESSLAFPGPRKLTAEEISETEKLLHALGKPSTEKFSFEHDGSRWRGQYDTEAVDGTWMILRQLPMVAPTLDTLPSPLPTAIYNALMSPDIGRGGLIHIAGGPGCGKTTTGSATAISRLLEYGGMCTTIEDPDEMKMNGWHGKGYCSQHCIDNWGEAMKRALRCQPSGSKNLMMYVGEVRDTEAARTMLRAANNGFLVISTGFGADIISGIETFLQYLPPNEHGQFANALRLIVYQHLDNEAQSLTVKMLRSESALSRVAATIRGGNLQGLLDEMMYQDTSS
ncbi:GspE family protein [Rugamonas sp. A1-17]|nr:GspE family protein [Rugamonas sp. A1-17]